MAMMVQKAVYRLTKTRMEVGKRIDGHVCDAELGSDVLDGWIGWMFAWFLRCEEALQLGRRRP